MENWLIHLGLSFTLSKLLPYIFFALTGVLLAWFLAKRFTKKWIKGLLFVTLPCAFFGIYFAIHPIYEGDFANESYTAETNLPFPSSTTLSVISLPHCPYCKESTKSMKILAKRGVKVEYLIISEEKKDSMNYAKLTGSKITCRLISRKFKLLALTRGSFPTFVLSNKHKVLKVWNNDQFGVLAKDEVCKFF